MRFYAVCTEAIRQTHRALAQLDHRRRGSLQPARTMRVATLYGHLQCRAKGTGEVQLLLGELAASWFLQPRLLREDLCDLQSLGWLRFRSGNRGTRITLLEPLSAADAAVDAAAEPTADAREAASPCASTTEQLCLEKMSPRESDPQPDHRGEAPSEPSGVELVQRFAQAYNSHKPPRWPAYTPRGSGLGPRLRRAIQHAGGAEAFWPLLIQALKAMPEFWRCGYPQGRSGADCAAVLFSADRSNSGLGPEFWHVFTWGAAAVAASGPRALGVQAESDFNRARRLLAWGDHAWIGQGMEAVKLPIEEKRRLAELLEAAGFGEAGQAARQFQPAADAP